jgi:hypothetical protein
MLKTLSSVAYIKLSVDVIRAKMKNTSILKALLFKELKEIASVLVLTSKVN